MEGCETRKKDCGDTGGVCWWATRLGDLPEERLQKQKPLILEVIACIVGASREPQAQTLVDVVKEEGGNPHSSVFSQGFQDIGDQRQAAERDDGAHL